MKEKETSPAITRIFSLKHHRVRIIRSNGKVFSGRFMEISYTSFCGCYLPTNIRHKLGTQVIRSRHSKFRCIVISDYTAGHLTATDYLLYFHIYRTVSESDTALSVKLLSACPCSLPTDSSSMHDD